MTPLEDLALDALERAGRSVDRRRRPDLYRAMMRLSGKALAAMQGDDEAGQEHVRLHFTRG